MRLKVPSGFFMGLAKNLKRWSLRQAFRSSFSGLKIRVFVILIFLHCVFGKNILTVLF